MKNDTIHLMKEKAGRSAVDEMVESGMKLGLGTGTTAVFAVRRVAELLAKGELRNISVFATSFQTEIECEKNKIPFYQLNSHKLEGSLDLTIDGADKVDSKNHLIKGGGGALLLEKIAAYASASYVIVVDESKITDSLALDFPVPVEVVPTARVLVTKSLEALDAKVVLREALQKCGPEITEHGNIILDIYFTSPVDAVLMERDINLIPGVVENGFFTKVNPLVYIARRDLSIEKRRFAQSSMEIVYS